MSLAMPRYSFAGEARKPSSARKKTMLAVCLAAVALAVVACISWISITESKTRDGQNDPDVTFIHEMVKRQFQGGGLIGDAPVETAVSALDNVLSAAPNVSPLISSLLPDDQPGPSSDVVIGSVNDAVSSLLGGSVPTPALDPTITNAEPLELTADNVLSSVTEGAMSSVGLSQVLNPVATAVGQFSTSEALVNQGTSLVDSLLNDGVTQALPIPTTPGALVDEGASMVDSLLSDAITSPVPASATEGIPTPVGPAISVTLPPLSSPISTDLNEGEIADDLESQAESVLSDGGALQISPSLPLSPLESEQVSVSLPFASSAAIGISPSLSLPKQSTLSSVDPNLPGLDDILADDGNTDVDSAALLSGLSNIVGQISDVDPEAAGDLTDAVVAALPEDAADIAGTIPSAQDAASSGSLGALDSIIPSLGEALGEDVIPAPPIDPSDTSGALGNVINRGKTVINQINEAMGDNIDPSLQSVIDNVLGIVDSAEDQLEDPLCLVSQVVQGATDQVLVPCAGAGSGATTTIAHLAPTQYQNPTQAQSSGQPQGVPQPESSSEQPQTGPEEPASPSDDTEQDTRPAQGSSASSGGTPAVPQAPVKENGTGSETVQVSTQGSSSPQSTGSNSGIRPPAESGGVVNSPTQFPSTEGSPNPQQPSGNLPQGHYGSGTASSDQSSLPKTGTSGAGGEENAASGGPNPTASSTQQQNGSSDKGSGGAGSPETSSGSTGSGQENPSPAQNEPGQSWDFPAADNGALEQDNTSSQGSAPAQGPSTHDTGSSPGAPATPTAPDSSSNAVPVSPVDDGCPICPQCMPQSCDGDYDFDADQSPCDGRGFECNECLHGWFCPPRETPAQDAPCGLGWPCYHCSDGWFCVPDEDELPDFFSSSNSNSGAAGNPMEYDDSEQVKRQGLADNEDDDEVNEYYSLGCFRDSVSRTLLGGVPVDYLSGRMSTSICVNHCLDGGYTFAGTENGHECWCGETMRPDAKKLPESSCQTPCHGNQGSTCGGNMAISIFADPDEYFEMIQPSRR